MLKLPNACPGGSEKGVSYPGLYPEFRQPEDSPPYTDPGANGQSSGNMSLLRVITANDYGPEGAVPDIDAAFLEAAAPREQDAMLRRYFADMLADISLTDVLALQEGRGVPRNMADYRLVPITNYDEDEPSYMPARFSLEIPEGVETNYRNPGEEPYVDTGLAAGLVYKGELTALAAAELTAGGMLYVMQLQTVTMKAADPKLKYKTGLHNGFYWRDTLVNIWEKIAERMGMPEIFIQCADNNYWLPDDADEETYEQYVKGYDEVAQRMGYIRKQYTNDWVKLIAANADRRALSAL